MIPSVASSNVVFTFALILVLTNVRTSRGLGEIVYAVNCGGAQHTDVHGIRYGKDPATVGTASEFGRTLIINRVHPTDQVLYQTERYHHNSFGYDVGLKEDGAYVLVLKFSEVYFTAPKLKVFSVVLNNAHTVVVELDIFSRVGRGVAHDEYVEFIVSDGKLQVNGEESSFNGKLRVDFVKGSADNPKVNAFYVMKGTLDDVPKLPPIATEQPEETDFVDTPVDDTPRKNRRPSGPRTPDPYTSDDGSLMLPLFVAIGAFIPLAFCLCKL